MNFRWNIYMQILIVFFFALSLSAATVDGIEIHSAVQGQGTDTVILVHGWTCDSSTWKSQVPALVKDYRVVTLDLPGHGKSGSPKEGKLSMDLFARAIEAVREEVKINRVVLAGHSMGTPVVVQYARLYPQHVAGLVFVDGVVTPPRIPEGTAFSAEMFSGPDGMKAREAMIRGMFTPATTEEMQRHILSMTSAAPEKTAVEAMQAIMDPAIWKEETFPQPVLVLNADRSNLDNPEYMKSRFPKLDYREIPGTGHFLMLEKPEEFNRLLLEFLGRVF